MQPLKLLPKPFKKAATTNNGITTNLNATAAAANSTFSMLSAVHQSSFYNLMQGSKQLVQSGLKQTYSGSIFCILQDQQNFHSSAINQKEEKGTGKGLDSSANDNDNLEDQTNNNVLEAEPISKAAIRQHPGRNNRCTRCGRPLRKLQSTLNTNEFFLECSNCGTIYDRGGSTHNSLHQEMRRKLDEIDKCPTPKQMTAYLDKFVIGQDDAKRALSLAVYEHYVRIGMNEEFRQRRRGNQTHGSMGRQLISNQLMSETVTISFDRVPFSNDVTIKQQQQQKPKCRSLPFQFDVGKLEEGDFVRMDKSNILLIGPSGVGKTYMIKILAEFMKVPMAHSDCTSMTQAGYVGEDVESVLTKLLQEADGNVARAEMGIVFLDEVDKIAKTRELGGHSYRDVSGEGVQHAMLKLVEGTTVNVKNGNGKKCNQDTVQVDTTDILFIGSGAFTGIDRQISRRLQKLTMGFGAAPPLNVITQDDKEQEVINEKRDRLLREVQADDVIKYGMIPEFVGRFPVRVPLYSLSRESLKRVMMEPENSMLAQARAFFKLHDAKLEFTDEALDEIAGKAIKDKTGARALVSILNDVLKDAKYNLPGSGVDTVRITGECIRGESSYEVIMKNKARQHPQVIHLHAPTVAAAI